MKTLRALLAPALVLSALLPAHAHAQTAHPLSFELRGGASVPTGEYREAVPTGWNVGAAVLLPVDSTLSLYAGFQHDQTSDLFDDQTLSDNGFRAGMRLGMPESRTSSAEAWLELGGMLNKLSLVNGWRLGLEGGIGLTLPVSSRVSFTPGLRYRSHTFSGRGILGRDGERAAYVSLDLGLQLHP
ncbi:MAG TPA: hypothetical protein VF705_09615 [Longimicrobium sp.]